MSNDKQSSIEWFANEISDYLNEVYGIDYYDYKLIEQAKAMRKEELELAFKGGMSLVEGHLWKPIDKFEQYYNETFNNHAKK